MKRLRSGRRAVGARPAERGRGRGRGRGSVLRVGLVAQVLPALAAVGAVRLVAADPREHREVVAQEALRHSVTRCQHLTFDLMAEHAGELILRGVQALPAAEVELALPHVELAVAEPGVRRADEDLGAGRDRELVLRDFVRLGVLDEGHCLLHAGGAARHAPELLRAGRRRGLHRGAQRGKRPGECATLRGPQSSFADGQTRARFQRTPACP